jgi:ribonuclease G
MYIHPFVDAYIKKGLFSLYGKWRRQYGRRFKIIPDESLAYLQYKVIDTSGKEIDLKEERDVNSSHTKSRTRTKNRDNDENNI